jgi:hypothetical protein
VQIETRLATVVVVAALLAACGGGGSGGAPPAVVPPPPTATESFCNSVSGQIGTATITGAVLLAPRAGGVASPCKVSGRIGAALNFEVTLPDNWNGRLLFIGGGGFDGVIPAPDTSPSPHTLDAGYAIIATDSGHQGTDASWALNNPNAVADYAELSTHKVLEAARAIVFKRFGNNGVAAYFEGCSNGGREALIAAQRFPDDFDGIIARAPAASDIGLVTAFNRIAKLVNAPGGVLSTGKLATLAAAERAACDALDGLDDAILGNLSACHVDPASLRCTGVDDDSCLTDAQIATVNGVRSSTPLPFAQADGLDHYPGFPLGNEDVLSGWPLWIVTGIPPATPPLQLVSQDQWIRYLILNDPSADPLTLSIAANAAAFGDASTLIDATNPDLSAFNAHGGKLILWHGVADYVVSVNGTIEYYDAVVAAAGGQANADAFVRFYTAPGVMHCADGPGADSVDLVSPLDAWVRQGSAPVSLVATHVDFNTKVAGLKRPLCEYPEYPHYNGAGDPNAAANFTCVVP